MTDIGAEQHSPLYQMLMSNSSPRPDTFRRLAAARSWKERMLSAPIGRPASTCCVTMAATNRRSWDQAEALGAERHSHTTTGLRQWKEKSIRSKDEIVVLSLSAAYFARQKMPPNSQNLLPSCGLHHDIHLVVYSHHGEANKLCSRLSYRATFALLA